MSDYKHVFDSAVELCSAILDAQQALKQLKADTKEDFIPEGTSQNDAKRIRAELTEVFALAMIEAKGIEERRKVAEKIERRERIAAEVGVQLAFPDIGEPVRMARAARPAAKTRDEALAKVAASPAMRRMRKSIASGEVSIEIPTDDGGRERIEADGAGGVRSVTVPPPINKADSLFRHSLEKEGCRVDPDTGEITAPPPASDAEALAEIGARVAAEAEGRPIDAPVMAAPADWAAGQQANPLLDVSDFMRRC